MLMQSLQGCDSRMAFSMPNASGQVCAGRRAGLAFAWPCYILPRKLLRPTNGLPGKQPMAQSAAQPAVSAQTIEAYVGEAMDNARMGPIHWRVLALVASGYFFDVIDFTIFGAMVPDLIKSGFVTQGAGSVDRQRHAARPVRRHARPGRIHRPVRPQGGLSVQPAAVRPGDDHRRAAGIPSIGFDPGSLAAASVSSPGSGSAPSSRCASPTPPNMRRSTSAAASSP